VLPALTARQVSTLAALADTFFPPGGAFPLGASDVNVAGRLNHHLAAFAPARRRQIGWLLTAWEYASVWRYRKPFTQLSGAERLECVEAARKGPLWQSFPVRVLQQLVGFAFGAAPEVEAALGFTHGCVGHTPPQRGARLSPIAYPEIQGEVDVTADVCVVGSGAGGAVVAKELADAGLQVVVIEEGGYFTRDDFNGPPFERMLKLYRDQGATVALGRPVIPVPLGKAVGGTTVVNSGTCFRTPSGVLAHWESAFGIEGIDAHTMAPIFETVEHTIGVRPAPWELLGANAHTFDRGVKALGLRGEAIHRNIRGCRGCGVCAFGCPSDAKQAMHLNYLPQAEALGARIYARCRAERVVIQHGRAYGVDATILEPTSDRPRGRLRVRAERVVVAAGTIHTPLLLWASGVGRRSGQLGRNLRLHPAVGVSAYFKEPLYAWRGTLQSYMVDHLAASDDVMLEVTNPVPSLVLAMGHAFGPRGKDAVARLPHLASTGLFVSDHSSGRVWQWRRGAPPVITYQLDQGDTRKLFRGMALAAEIFLAAGAETVMTQLPALPEVRSRADVETLRAGESWTAAALHPTGFHPMGTCRMGRNPDAAVVNPHGESHEVRNLYVADASLFPTCVGVNPQVTIMAFATRIARHMVGR
jgi:choline dehydrogenase-like flavoprotein